MHLIAALLETKARDQWASSFCAYMSGRGTQYQYASVVWALVLPPLAAEQYWRHQMDVRRVVSTHLCLHPDVPVM